MGTALLAAPLILTVFSSRRWRGTAEATAGGYQPAPVYADPNPERPTAPPAPTYQAPDYEAPAYQAPTYSPPTYEPPVYTPPGSASTYPPPTYPPPGSASGFDPPSDGERTA
jgi:hypothetical protein